MTCNERNARMRMRITGIGTYTQIIVTKGEVNARPAVLGVLFRLCFGFDLKNQKSQKKKSHSVRAKLHFEGTCARWNEDMHVECAGAL